MERNGVWRHFEARKPIVQIVEVMLRLLFEPASLFMKYLMLACNWTISGVHVPPKCVPHYSGRRDKRP
jgi:hypothetical protein